MAATQRDAGAARAPAPADLAVRATPVFLRAALDGLPGPARAGPHRATRAAAEQPLAERGDPDESAGGPARPGADLAGERRAVVSAGGGHLPLRPLWLCRACAAPWPCAPARLGLLHEYAGDRIALLVYLGGLLHDAAGELHRLHPDDGPAPAQLFARFLGWALPRRPPARPPLSGDAGHEGPAVSGDSSLPSRS